MGPVLNFLLAFTFYVIAFTAKAETSDGAFFGVTIAPHFTPLDGLFLIENEDGNIWRAQGVLRSSSAGAEADLSGRRWILGTKLPIPLNVKKINIGGVVLGESIESSLAIPRHAVTVSDQNVSLGTIESLRDELDSRKSELLEKNSEALLQQESLGRLRADAAIIADVEKIRVLKEEIELSEQSLARLDGDISSLQEAVKAAKRRPAPKNHATREAELLRQVSELVSLAKVAEGGENYRGTSAELTLRGKLALIESTRFDDPLTLQRTLDRLRDSIKRLENSNNNPQ